MLQPKDVFTTGIPVGKSYVYANRLHSQNRLLGILDDGNFPLVYGGYGTGKTSLVRHVTLQAEKEERLVYIANVGGMKFVEVTNRIMSHLKVHITKSVEKEEGKNRGAEQGGEIESGFLNFIKAKVTARTRQDWSTKRKEIKELVVKSLSEDEIIKIANDVGLYLVLDELHKADEEFKRGLSDFQKRCKNNNCDDLKIIMLGTENDPWSLVKIDQGNRAVREVEVFTMKKEESDEIVDSGMNLLGLVVGAEFNRLIFSASAGAPSVIQNLCLYASKYAREIGSGQVDKPSFDAALAKYSDEIKTASMAKCMAVIETKGKKRPRKLILMAMAMSDKPYFTMEELIVAIKSLGTDVKNNELSGPLKRLKSVECGPILTNLKNSEDGVVQNYTTFYDPAIKAALRLMFSDSTQRKLV